MKTAFFRAAVTVILLFFLAPGRTAAPDVVWTKSFNYSGKITEEAADYVVILTGQGAKKIPRENIEGITYSERAVLPPESRDKIRAAEQSREQAVQEQLKWQKEHPGEYARQLRELEEEQRREEQEQRRRVAEEERLKRLEEEPEPEEELPPPGDRPGDWTVETAPDGTAG